MVRIVEVSLSVRPLAALPFDFTFTAGDVTDRPALFGSSHRAPEQLRKLNDATCRADERQLDA